MTDNSNLHGRLRAVAGQLGLAVDHPVYAEAGRDPLEPVLGGSGSVSARVGVFGRDPGRHEILRGEPFVGAGGLLVRDGLLAARRPGAPRDDAARQAIGREVCWANTVPYKPVGNKAWSVPVKRAFAPLIAEWLGDVWQGTELLVLGADALAWFGLADPSLAGAVADFQAREDRYTASLSLSVRGRAIRVHPLPHPSPLNVRWYRRFPELLAGRLAALGVGPAGWG
jgi:uracil-DNA glycosylase